MLAGNGLNKRKLHFLKPLKKQNRLNIILLDTSASTLGKDGLLKAKGAIKKLAEAAYLKRERLCLITFGNERIKTILHLQRAPKNILPVLNGIQAGGGTPLRKAITQVGSYISKQSYRYEKCMLYIFTDGRTRDVIDEQVINAEVMLVDMENSDVKLGLTKVLADRLDAQYVQL